MLRAASPFPACLLPRASLAADYTLEYGTATLELHADAIRPGQRVLVVDDVLATGGTAEATAKLAAQLGGELVGFSFLMVLSFLDGAKRLGAERVRSVITL